MVINLDVLFDPANWPKDLVKQPKGLAVIEGCLEGTLAMPSQIALKNSDANCKAMVKHNPKLSSPVLEQKQRTQRKKTVPAKLDQYVRATAPTCPKCQKYVKHTDDGVACEKCQAFWHYCCAGVSQNEIDENWSGKPFLCQEHREACPLSTVTASEVAQEESVKVMVKVHSYKLNPQLAVKKLLSAFNLKPTIEPREGKQQYYVRICPPTFELLVANMTEFGQQWGISIKTGGVDSKGTAVSTQFNVELVSRVGHQVKVSMTCYSTTSSIHLQLNKGSKGQPGWEEKMTCFSHFVTHTLQHALLSVEETEEFHNLKEMMRSELEKSKANQIDGGKKSQVIQPSPSTGALADISQCSSLKEAEEGEGVTKVPPSPGKGNKKKTAELVKIQSLEKEKIGLKQEVETLKTHQETLRNTIQSKNDLLETQTKVVSDQQEKLSKQKQEIEDLKIASANHSKFADSFLDCLVAAEGDNEVLVREHEVNVKQELYKSIQEKDDSISALSEEKSKLEEEVKNLSESLGKLSDVEEKYSSLVKKFEAKTKENAALVAQIATMEKSVVSRKKDLDASVAEVADLRNERESLRIDLVSAREKLNESDNLNESLKDELKQLQYSLENPESHEMYKQLCQQMKLKEEEITNLQETNAYAEKSLNELKIQVQEKEDLVNLVQNQVKDESKLRLEFQEKLSHCEVENQQFSRKVTALTIQLERSRLLALLPDESDSESPIVSAHPVPSCQNVPRQNVPCIFEVRGEKRCHRGNKCAFDHNFNPTLKNDVEAIETLFHETSCRIKRCAKEMVDGVCPNLEQCPHTHKSQNPSLNPATKGMRICFRELVEEHSCKRKSGTCKFSHKISEEQRNDPSFLEQARKFKDEKASKCINEFEAVGKCHRGLKCPFSHTISEEDRKNSELKKRMADTKNIALGKSNEELSPDKSVIAKDDDLKNILLALMADVKELKEKQSRP